MKLFEEELIDRRTPDEEPAQCEMCHDWFNIDDLDFISVDENESILVCNNCEENHKRWCQDE